MYFWGYKVIPKWIYCSTDNSARWHKTCINEGYTALAYCDALDLYACLLRECLHGYGRACGTYTLEE